MAKNAYFGTDTGNFGTGTAMYDTEHTSAGGQNRLVSSFKNSVPPVVCVEHTVAQLSVWFACCVLNMN